MAKGNPKPARDPRKSRLSPVSLLFGGVILGAACGASLAGLGADRSFETWYSLGTPSEPATNILFASPFSIEIEAASGKQYSFEPNDSGSYALSGTWHTEDTFIQKDLREPICDFDQSYASLPRIAKTVDYAALAWCPEIIVDIQYAILDDGSVWRWDSQHARGTATIPSPWLIPIGIAFLVGAALVFGGARWQNPEVYKLSQK